MSRLSAHWLEYQDRADVDPPVGQPLHVLNDAAELGDFKEGAGIPILTRSLFEGGILRKLLWLD
jgi:hypothetical protein